MKKFMGPILVLLLLLMCLPTTAPSKQAFDPPSGVAAEDSYSAGAAIEVARLTPPVDVRSPHRLIKVLFNTIYDGNDYHHFRMRGINWSECAKACKKDPRCRAWSMVKGGKGCEPTGPLCWLKTAASPPRANVCAISGLKSP